MNPTRQLIEIKRQQAQHQIRKSHKLDILQQNRLKYTQIQPNTPFQSQIDQFTSHNLKQQYLIQQIQHNINNLDNLVILLDHQNELLKSDDNCNQDAYYNGLMQQIIAILKQYEQDTILELVGKILTNMWSEDTINYQYNQQQYEVYIYLLPHFVRICQHCQNNAQDNTLTPLISCLANLFQDSTQSLNSFISQKHHCRIVKLTNAIPVYYYLSIMISCCIAAKDNTINQIYEYLEQQTIDLFKQNNQQTEDSDIQFLLLQGYCLLFNSNETSFIQEVIAKQGFVELISSSIRHQQLPILMISIHILQIISQEHFPIHLLHLDYQSQQQQQQEQQKQQPILIQRLQQCLKMQLNPKSLHQLLYLIHNLMLQPELKCHVLLKHVIDKYEIMNIQNKEDVIIMLTEFIRKYSWDAFEQYKLDIDKVYDVILIARDFMMECIIIKLLDLIEIVLHSAPQNSLQIVINSLDKHKISSYIEQLNSNSNSIEIYRKTKNILSNYYDCDVY